MGCIFIFLVQVFFNNIHVVNLYRNCIENHHPQKYCHQAASEVSAKYFFRVIYRRYGEYHAKPIFYSNLTTIISNFTQFLYVLVALAEFFRIVLAFLY